MSDENRNRSDDQPLYGKENYACRACGDVKDAYEYGRREFTPRDPGTQEDKTDPCCASFRSGGRHTDACAGRRTREATVPERNTLNMWPRVSSADLRRHGDLVRVDVVAGFRWAIVRWDGDDRDHLVDPAVLFDAQRMRRNDATAAEVAGIPKSTDACDHCEHYGDLDRAYIEDTSKLKAEIQRMGRSEARPEGVERARGAIEERRMVAGFLRGFGSFQPAFSGDMLAAKIECCEHHKRENRWEPIGGEARPDAVFPAEAVAASVGRGTCGLCKRTFPPADSAMCCRCDGSFVIQTESGAPEILRPDRSKAPVSQPDGAAWASLVSERDAARAEAADYKRMLWEERNTSERLTVTLMRPMYESACALLDEAGFPGIVGQQVRTIEDRIRDLVASRGRPDAPVTQQRVFHCGCEKVDRCVRDQCPACCYCGREPEIVPVRERARP